MGRLLRRRSDQAQGLRLPGRHDPEGRDALRCKGAGQLAAQVAIEAITAGDTSAAFLSHYEERWYHATGRRLQRNYRLREKFPPEQRCDERFVRAFALAAS